MKELRLGFIDLEIQSSLEFPKPEFAKYPISAITHYDSYLDRYFTLTYAAEQKVEFIQRAPNWNIYHFDDPLQLAIKYVKLLRFLDPDVMIGFYSRKFDFPYLFKWFENNKLPISAFSNIGIAYYSREKPVIEGRHVIDLYDADRSFKKRSSYKLKDIAIEENLPVKKMEIDCNPGRVLELRGMSIMEEYNKIDVETTVEMDKKLQHLKRYVSRWRFAGLDDLDKAMSNSVVIDNVMLRDAFSNKIVLPSKPEKSNEEHEDDDDITGGLVLPPIIGIHDWVCVFDMSRFYPNLILLLCMSPENISDLGTLVSANGTRFINNPNAFLPRIVAKFFVERDKVQEEKKKFSPDDPIYWKLQEEDDNIKFLVNAIFGVTGLKSFRLFDPRITDSITTSGQAMILEVKAYNESKGYIVTAGDTDANHTKMNVSSLEEALTLGKSLAAELNTMFPIWAKKHFNVDNGHSLKIEFEKVFQRIVYIPKKDGDGAKKRYFARLIYEKGKPADQIYVRGLDYRRSDASKVTKNMQWEIMKIILYTEDPIEMKNKIIAYLRPIIDNFTSMSLSDIGMPQTYTKPLTEYGREGKGGKRIGLDPEIRAGLYCNNYLNTNYGDGSTVKLLHIKKIEGYPFIDVIVFDDETTLPKVEVDYEKMLDSTIRKKIERIISVAGVGWNEVIGTPSLFD